LFLAISEFKLEIEEEFDRNSIIEAGLVAPEAAAHEELEIFKTNNFMSFEMMLSLLKRGLALKRTTLSK
jgi:hypothetical protein